MQKTFHFYVKQITLISLVVAGHISTSYAQNWDKVIKAVAGDRETRTSVSRAAGDMYGSAVAISGDYAIVGAPGEQQNEFGINDYVEGVTGAGAAYILHYENGSWKTIQKICAPVRAEADWFGRSVAISGDYLVVGSQGDRLDDLNRDAGAAYVFKRKQDGGRYWEMVKKITAPIRSANDRFGLAVSISGNYIVVGAPGDREDEAETNSLFDAGSVYIFKKDNGGENNWGLLKKITAPVRKGVDYFGSAVSIDGDYFVVGVEEEDEDASENNSMFSAGAAYVFWKNKGGEDNWGIDRKITSPVRKASDYFGASVSISGENLIVGADSEDEDAQEQNEVNSAGAAYIFKRDLGGEHNWGLVRKITAPTRHEEDYFGSAVSISGDYAVVGAYLEDEDALEINTLSGAGAGYIYGLNEGGENNWGLVKKITSGTRHEGDLFGLSVALSGDHVFIGAPYEDEDESVSDAGSAYIFKKDQGGTNSWGIVQKSVTMDRAASDNFGSAVAISGKYAVVGVYLEDEDSNGLNTLRDAGAVYVFYNNSGIWTQVKKLTAPVRTMGAYFGYSVSIEGEQIIVGSPRESGSGAAYLFKMNQGGSNNWGFVKKLFAADGQLNDNFGYSVSISGNYAVAGSLYHSYDGSGSSFVRSAGAAYIFKMDQGGEGNWGLLKKINANSRGEDDNLGNAVSISGDYLVVSAYNEDEDENEANFLNYSGSCYIFRKNKGGNDNWGFIKKITAPVRMASAYFGRSVSIDGNHIVVGAHLETKDTFYGLGAAYIFDKDSDNEDNWIFAKKITPPVISAGSLNFGLSVSISGSNLIVSSHGDQFDVSEENPLYFAGAAHIFNKNKGGDGNWGHVKKLTSPIRAAEDLFGWNVAISGGQAIVASLTDNEDVNEESFLKDAGSVYFFERACSEPLTLASSNITNKTATISWSEPLVIPGGGYEYYYSTSNATPADNAIAHGTTTAGVTSANLSGLQPATTYYYWVRSSCSVGYASVWVAGASFMTEACPAAIADLTIPTETGVYQSVQVIQEGSLTHYCDCANNYLLLTLDQSGSGAVIPADGIKIKVGSGASFYVNGTGFITSTFGTAMFNRWWAVQPSTQPTADVKVRFYYTTDDYNAVNATLAANHKMPLTNETQMLFYKVTDPALGEFAAVADIPSTKVVLIANGVSPGLESWVAGVAGVHKYAEFKVSSFSGGGGGGVPAGDVLPVTLASFEASDFEGKSSLKWATASEINTDYFEIQRSEDGRHWQMLAKVDAAFESKMLLHYSYTDVKPISGQNFYRLKMVDRDGTFAMSRIESVVHRSTEPVSIFPNPVTDRLFLVSNEIEKVSSVHISNSLGQEVGRYWSVTEKGISMTNFSAGVYIVEVKKKDGSASLHRVVVIR